MAAAIWSGGKGRVGDHLAADDPQATDKRQPVGVQVLGKRGGVQHRPQGVVDQQVRPDLLGDQLGALGAQHLPGAALGRLQLRQRGLDLPPLGVQRGQLVGGCHGGVKDRGHQPVAVGAGAPARVGQGVLDHPHGDRVALAAVGARIQAREPRPVRKHLVDRQLGGGLAAAFDPPHQVRAGPGHLPPQLGADKQPVGQQQHPRPKPAPIAGQVACQRLLPAGVGTLDGVDDRVRARLHQPHHPHLRERAHPLPAAAFCPTQRLVGGAVGHVQAGPVHHQQPPPSIPRAPGRLGRQWPRGLREQHLERLGAQPLTRLGQRRGTRHVPVRPGAPAPPRLHCPAQPLHQAAHDLLVGRVAVQRQRQHEVDDHAGGQQPAALLGPASLLHDPIDQVGWERAGQRAKRDPVGDRRRRGQRGGCGGCHPVVSAPSRNDKERTLPRQSSKPDGIGARDLATRPAVADEAAQVRNGLAWWRGQLQRVASLTDAIPADLRAWALAEVRKTNDVGLLRLRDMAGEEWGNPVTIAVARQELDRLTRLRLTNHPEPSGPLLQLMLGSLAVEELNRRLALRLEAAIADPPTYLLAMLGPYPPSDAAQLTWTQAALDVEDFRLEYQITDAQQALGAADIAMPLDRRERFHALNRSLAEARIELDRAELGRMGGADSRGWRSYGAADPKPNRPAGRQEPDESLPRDVPAGLPGAGAVEPGADSRPDERLTQHLRGLAQVLPAWTRAAAARLPDDDLAACWQTAMAYSLGRDLGPPIELQFESKIELGSDGGSFRVHYDDPGRSTVATPAPLLEAAAMIEELDRRVEAKVQAAIADPPPHILRALGSWPHSPGASALWEVEAVEIEHYRLVTGTSNPTHPLGPPEPPGNSWRQCWRRALTQNLAQCGSTWMRYRHSVFGSAEERADVADIVASATDPWLSVRPGATMLAEHENLSTSTLRSRVVHAAALLAGSWPPVRGVGHRPQSLRRTRTLCATATSPARRRAAPAGAAWFGHHATCQGRPSGHQDDHRQARTDLGTPPRAARRHRPRDRPARAGP